MVREHCHSSYCHLPINKFQFNLCCTFQVMAPTSNHYDYMTVDGLISVLTDCMCAFIEFASLVE